MPRFFPINVTSHTAYNLHGVCHWRNQWQLYW